MFGQLKPRFAVDYFINGYDTKFVKTIIIDDADQEFSTKINNGNFRIRIGANYDFKHFNLYFDQNIYMNKAKNISFQPLQAEWFTGINIKVYKKIRVSYEHLCIHPIISNNTFNSQHKIYGGYNMFSISYGYE